MRNARRFVASVILAGAAVLLSSGPVHADVIWTRAEGSQAQPATAPAAPPVAGKATVTTMADVIWT
ncbi:hypothetical protein [Kitasatospora sp. NBC_00315]|uniref:hypothetical protein n=1 Tax=Kitasatospora sp. NBC_00315 TaxID=2975963 RepID=UPI0032468CAC